MDPAGRGSCLEFVPRPWPRRSLAAAGPIAAVRPPCGLSVCCVVRLVRSVANARVRGWFLRLRVCLCVTAGEFCRLLDSVVFLVAAYRRFRRIFVASRRVIAFSRSVCVVGHRHAFFRWFSLASCYFLSTVCRNSCDVILDH